MMETWFWCLSLHIWGLQIRTRNGGFFQDVSQIGYYTDQLMVGACVLYGLVVDGPGNSIAFTFANNNNAEVQGNQVDDVKCLAECNPSCSYAWTGSPVIGNSAVIALGSAWTYICQASNKYGVAEKNVTLNASRKYVHYKYIDDSRITNTIARLCHWNAPLLLEFCEISLPDWLETSGTCSHAYVTNLSTGRVLLNRSTRQRIVWYTN
jgi:hypothetical protein